MRIAIVHEAWQFSGAARCALDLDRELRARHDVEYFPRTPAGIAESPEAIFLGLAEFAPDVVNCHSFWGNLPYSSLARLSRLYPVCFTVHDPRPIGTFETPCWECSHNAWCVRCPMVGGRLPKPWNWFARERIVKRLCHARCAANLTIVAPSKWMADRLANQELRRFSIRTIPNGIDLEKFSPGPAVRERFGLPPDVPVLLHIAAGEKQWVVNDRKGLPYLAEAFIESVLPRFPSAVLAVAGERLVPNHPNVRPVGKVTQDDLPDLLRSSDVFVSATLADNLPYTVLEAMGCARPVVAFCVGGVPEQIVDGQTGLLTPPRDAGPLGAALVSLLSAPDRLAAMGRAGRQRAEQVYGMDTFVARYEGLYRELSARRP
jgi:glycosyltransferase involved in cell wall biosynthesis